MRNHRFFGLSVLFCFVLCCVAGCGSGSSVSGTVKFPDGSPLTVGKVMFTNGSVTAFGTINGKGEFRMGMKKAGDGVPSGTYQVYITEAFVPGDKDKFSKQDGEGELFVPMILAIDPKFTTADKSGLTCEVKGSRKYDIDVEKPPASYSPLVTRGAK